MADFWSRLFFIFLFYSISGWIIETIRVSLRNKKFAYRGFLLGPYCPIYGFGAVSLDLLLDKVTNKPILYFFLSIIIAAIIEYLTSYLMEKKFNARWWDYSDRALNLNGRICAENLLQFAFFGTIVMCYINKTIINKFYMLPKSIRYISMLICFIIVITDFIISSILNKKVKDDIDKLSRDNSNEMNKKVKELIKKRNIFTRRLFIAYPELKLKVKKIKDNISSEIKVGKEKD